jgi:hypothetical protein
LKGIEDDINELAKQNLLSIAFLGIRLLDGEVTDLVESMALSFRPDFIDIYSASW